MLEGGSLAQFYVRGLRTVLRNAGGAFAFSLASLMHALGHAALALAAGACARALVGASGLMGARSTGPAAIPLGADVALSLAFVGLIATIVKGVGGMYASYWQARIAGELGGVLRLDVLDGWLAVHRLRQPRQPDHGRLSANGVAAGTGTGTGQGEVGRHAQGVAALTIRVREVEVGLGKGVLGGLRALVQLVPLALALVVIAPRLALAALSVFVPFALLLTRSRRRWKSAHARASREGDALLEAADEAVRHADLWTTFGAESHVRANVAMLGRAIARQAAKLDASAAALSAGNEALGALALVLALAAAHLGWLGRAGTGGTLLSFTVVFFLAYRPLRELTEARLAFTRANLAFEELREALPPPAPTPMAREKERSDPWPLAALELRDVRLERGTGASLSFCVEPGHIVAIRGPTGAGKTTLLRALLGLEPTMSGDILYAGASLAGAGPGPHARPFAWVPQDAPLLADTLDANLSLGGPADASAVLRPLGASHLLAELGLARLGAGGRAVSGGERQWIALARALASRQPILLLDEPTSGLDAASQAEVLEAIVRLRGERSILLVTHRPEPLAIADSVISVD
jgi:ABC-type multidrug transport system fused ATPase/permease subunit